MMKKANSRVSQKKISLNTESQAGETNNRGVDFQQKLSYLVAASACWLELSANAQALNGKKSLL